MSSNNNESDKNKSKRTSPSRRAVADSDNDRVPELIDLSDEDDAANSVSNARRGWRRARGSRPEIQPTSTAGSDNNRGSAAVRNSHYNEIDGSDTPPPPLDDDDDFVEMAPVAAADRSSRHHGKFACSFTAVFGQFVKV